MILFGCESVKLESLVYYTEHILSYLVLVKWYTHSAHIQHLMFCLCGVVSCVDFKEEAISTGNEYILLYVCLKVKVKMLG